MSHTKRTLEFQDKIKKLVSILESLCPEGGGDRFTVALDEATHVLRNNTTDSPCIVKAADDEPIFVLRAQDDTADRFVKGWAENALTIAANLTEADPKYERIRAKAMDAILCASEFRDYPNRRRPD